MEINNTNQNSHKMSWIVGVAAVVLIVVVIVLMVRSSKKRAAGASVDTAAIQEQINNDPKLKEFVDSPRNNFKKGEYKLSSEESFVEWSYKDFSGKIPVKSGTLKALDSGMIETFTANIDTGSIEVTKGDAAKVKGVITSQNAVMKALTILPNTSDDAFTVAFTLDAGGKSTSLATGLYIKKEEAKVVVSGDVYLDGKTVLTPAGYNTGDNLRLKINYVFE
jgi:hypothetical protein